MSLVGLWVSSTLNKFVVTQDNQRYFGVSQNSCIPPCVNKMTRIGVWGFLFPSELLENSSARLQREKKNKIKTALVQSTHLFHFSLHLSEQ